MTAEEPKEATQQQEQKQQPVDQPNFQELWEEMSAMHEESSRQVAVLRVVVSRQKSAIEQLRNELVNLSTPGEDSAPKTQSGS